VNPRAGLTRYLAMKTVGAMGPQGAAVDLLVADVERGGGYSTVTRVVPDGQNNQEPDLAPRGWVKPAVSRSARL